MSQFSILTIFKLKAINNHKSLINRLNPEPVYNHYPPNLKEWDIFKIKGLHLLHLKVISNATVTRITEPKLGNYTLDSEIQIDDYQILRSDRNRKGGGVDCCARNDLSYIEKEFFPEEIENIFFEMLLSKTKLIPVGISHRPPNQNNFLQTLNENFAQN